MPETSPSPWRIPGVSQHRFPSLVGGHCLSQHMVLLRMQVRNILLIDANASLNDEAGIHCGGSEATKENVAGTALKELVAERALCFPQTVSKFGPTWHNRRLDFNAIPLNWHAAVSDIKVEPSEILAINDFVDQPGSHAHGYLAPGKMSEQGTTPEFPACSHPDAGSHGSVREHMGPSPHAACDMGSGID